MAQYTESILCETYASELKHTLKQLRQSPPRIHIPSRQNLYSKQLKAPFHAYPEVFIQTGGATDFVCPGSQFRLETGELCVMPRGLPHAETPINGKTPYGVCVVGILMGHMFYIRGRNSGDGPIQSYDALILKKSVGHEIARYLDDISEHASLLTEHRQGYILALLETYFIRAHHELCHETDTAPLKRPHLIIQAENYARIHLGDSTLTVKRIAEALGCSADHLSRQFHRSHNYTLINWLNRERIKMAKFLLEKEPQNIAEIGWACGFNTSSYFIRTFKDHTGMTPKAYRKSITTPPNEEFDG